MDTSELDFDQRLLSEVQSAFEVGSAIAGVRLQSSDWSWVGRVETTAGSFILKACQGPSAANLAFQHQVLAHMAEQVDVVLAPLPSRAGTTSVILGEQRFTLFQDVVGQPADQDRRPHRLAAARLLARLHRVGTSFVPVTAPKYPSCGELDWDDNPLWRWEEVFGRLQSVDALLASFSGAGPEMVRLAEVIVGQADFLARERRVVQAWLATLRSTQALVRGPVHGDFYGGNLLMQGDEVGAVIDWDETRMDWLVYELARSTWEFCHVGPCLDMHRAREFLQAYMHAGGPVPERELDLVLPFIRAIRVEEVLCNLAEPMRTRSWNAEQMAYVQHNLQALSQLGDSGRPFDRSVDLS